MHKNAKISIGTTSFGVAAISTTIVLLASSADAHALDLQQRQQFNIPSERLEVALAAFSGQTRIHVVTSGVPSGALSPGASGNVSTVDALSALLRGTGMSFRQVDGGTIVVVPARVAKLSSAQLRLAADVDQNALADQPTAGAAPGAAAPGAALNEVQVTGTRIIRQGYEAPTPVTSVGLQDLQDLAPANLADTLVDLPVFQGSTVSTSASDGAEGEQNELNLRNLGATRTLVLFDGRRLPTSNTENVPNIALVPDALVQRVDVVTGGASAVYGSDAIAGVTNFILDTNFTGIKGLLQGGISGVGDGLSHKVQLSAGTVLLGGRLHLLISGDEKYQWDVPGDQRAWLANGESSIQNPAFVNNKNAPQYIGPFEHVSTTYPPGGMILSGPLQGTDFLTGGQVGQYDYGYGVQTAGSQTSGGDWSLSTMHGLTAVLPFSRDTHIFTRVGFDITPTVQAYAEYMNGDSFSVGTCCNDYYQTGIGTLYTNNPFLPASVAAKAATLGVTSFSIGTSLRFADEGQTDGGISNPIYRSNDVYAVGLKGSLSIGKDSYNWNVYAQQGVSIQDDRDGPESNRTNLSNSIEAVTVGSYGGNTAYTTPFTFSGGNGVTTQAAYTAANFPNPLGIANATITCASNLLPRSNPAATSDRVPFNVFGDTPCPKTVSSSGLCTVASPGAESYTQQFNIVHEVGTQSVVGADISGEPFSLWAGPVSVALDAEWRHESVSGFNDPLAPNLAYFSRNSIAYYGSEHVEEGALEVVVPLLKSLPFAQSLDFNAGARATDYSTSGYVTTYKYGLEFTPINDLRLRVTDSYDIRAPSLFQLYGASYGHGTDIDPFFGNINAPAFGTTKGNTALRPEKAHQYEVGLVFQPAEVPGLNISVDYYHIRVYGEISSLAANYILTSCYNTRIPGTFTGTSSLCSLIQRLSDGSGTLIGVTTTNFNIASFLTSGTDYNLDYRKNLTELVSSWKGALDFHLTATNTIHNKSDSGIQQPTRILEGAGVGLVPRWAVFGTLTYDLDPWRFAWSERYVSSVLGSNVDIICQTNCPNPIPAGFSTVAYQPRIPTYFVANFSVQYKFWQNGQQQAQAFLNIDNVFNREPPWNEAIPGQLFIFTTNPAEYDTVGTYLRAGVRFRL
jgi:iron complex outermembrane receptor protein